MAGLFWDLAEASLDTAPPGGAPRDEEQINPSP